MKRITFPGQKDHGEGAVGFIGRAIRGIRAVRLDRFGGGRKFQTEIVEKMIAQPLERAVMPSPYPRNIGLRRAHDFLGGFHGYPGAHRFRIHSSFLARGFMG